LIRSGDGCPGAIIRLISPETTDNPALTGRSESRGSSRDQSRRTGNDVDIISVMERRAAVWGVIKHQPWVSAAVQCVAATRERGRLCLDFGSEGASFTISDFGLERLVRLGLRLASICSSTFAATDSAVASVFGLRPRPSCLASVERRSE
jgi:hypothetical protein